MHHSPRAVALSRTFTDTDASLAQARAAPLFMLSPRLRLILFAFGVADASLIAPSWARTTCIGGHRRRCRALIGMGSDNIFIDEDGVVSDRGFGATLSDGERAAMKNGEQKRFAALQTADVAGELDAKQQAAQAAQALEKALSAQRRAAAAAIVQRPDPGVNASNCAKTAMQHD